MSEKQEHSKGGVYSVKGEEYSRDSRYIETRIVREPREGTDDCPVVPNRYRLVAAYACPWANRTIIVRELLGLEDVISLGMPGPTHDARLVDLRPRPGRGGSGARHPPHQGRLREAFPGYLRGITVPAVVDVPTGVVVTNDFPQITEDFFFEWKEFHKQGAPNLWPEDLREEMEEVMRRIYTEVNNGVYRCGFAGSQDAYEAAYARLWEALDWLEERLATRRYLMGGTITEADVRLFTTLVRFDPVYHGHFKANRNKLIEMPNLWGYARDLFQTPGFGDTIDFEQIKKHYYVVHTDLNPLSIVPKGPDLSGWDTPHGREALAG